MTAPSISNLPFPDPLADEGDWCALYSPASLRLTLEDIVKECTQPDKPLLEEFPPPTDPLSLLDTATTVPCTSFLSPSKPAVNMDPDILSRRCQQLETLLTVYQERIRWLSSESRLHFGHLSHPRVALLVEASDRLCNDADTFMKLSCSLKALVCEQLLEKKALYLVKFGSEVCQPLTVAAERERQKSTQLACDWLSSLKASGTCNLLGALKTALRLRNIDTICVVLATSPDQRASVVLDYAVDKLSGRSSPQLHLVAFNCEEESALFLKQLADQTGGYYHRFSLPSSEDQKCELPEDTSISRLQEEIQRVKRTLSELDNLKSGNLTQPLIQELQGVSVNMAWPESSIPAPSSPPFKNDTTLCDSQQWLCQHGLAARGLNLYRVLAPNAYHQLEGYVPIVDKKVVSEVYEVMPLFPWHDGSYKYLHVDVPMLEQYQEKLKEFMGMELQRRLQWLLSGSRVPFGVIAEERVVIAVDCSYALRVGLLPLQCHLKALLTEQLPRTTAFGLLRLGAKCSLWTPGMAETNGQSLATAWKWVLGLRPAGSCDILSGLRCIFEGDTVFQSERELENTGIYLIACAMPDQDVSILCSYLEQQVSGRRLMVHVVFYDIHPLMGSEVIPGRDGGRYGGQEEVEEGLKRIAEAGGGRFHHFVVSGEAGARDPSQDFVEGDDITALLEEAVEAQFYFQTSGSILENYREFCKRHMSPTEEDTLSPPVTVTTPPPVHPRQNTASLARLNACSQRLSQSDSVVDLGKKKARVTVRKHMKTEMFYLDQGIRKGIAWDIIEVSPHSKSKHKPLIPLKEEHISSKAWLSKHGLEMLGLRFESLTVGNSNCKTVYKHINHRGDVVELRVSHRGLKGYVQRLQTTIDRYHSRLEWLLEDYHKYFGIITEKKVLFLLDVSSSMTSYIQELKNGLTSLLERKPMKMEGFNIVTYASTVTKWREQLSGMSEKDCLEAAQWLQSVRAGGCSCLLDALKVSLQSEATGIYLVTDGTADHTHEFLLNQLPILRHCFGDSWRINTVAFHCSSEKSHYFLRTLANSCSGRYHSYPFSAVDVKGKGNLELLAKSETLSDDLRLVVQEILAAQNDLEQAKTFL